MTAFAKSSQSLRDKLLARSPDGLVPRPARRRSPLHAPRHWRSCRTSHPRLGRAWRIRSHPRRHRRSLPFASCQPGNAFFRRCRRTLSWLHRRKKSHLGAPGHHRILLLLELSGGSRSAILLRRTARPGHLHLRHRCAPSAWPTALGWSIALFRGGAWAAVLSLLLWPLDAYRPARARRRRLLQRTGFLPRFGRTTWPRANKPVATNLGVPLASAGATSSIPHSPRRRARLASHRQCARGASGRLHTRLVSLSSCSNMPTCSSRAPSR